MPAQTSTESRIPGYGLSLSREEVEKLLDTQSPQSALTSITGKIAGAYGQARIEPIDLKAAEQIFRLLVRDTEVQVRRALSEQIKSSTQVPRDIVLTLAHDVGEVAIPVLQYSDVLTDSDLVELVRSNHDNLCDLAIARRVSLSDIVSGSLLDKDGEGIATTLVQNNGARISETRLEGIVAAHGSNTALMQALRNRANLPPVIAAKLTHAVTATLTDALQQKHPQMDKDFGIAIDKARDAETLKLVHQSSAQKDIDHLINQLIAFSRLTPSLILSSLCQGDFLFFETSLARLAGVPVANARTLINDRGDLGFRAIYNKSGLPESLFQAVRQLLKAVRTLDGQGHTSDAQGYASRLIDYLLKQPAADNLSYIVALIRQTVA